MNLGMNIDQAEELLNWTLNEGVGCLLYTSDPTYIMQVLYQARRRDPSLEEIHISQRSEGLVIWHTQNKGKGLNLW